MSDNYPTPLSKVDYVLERMQQDINDGHIIPGQPLRQADLANRYGVSATPIREALRRLEAEGRVSYHAHKGATVRELGQGSVLHLYRIRSSIEGLAARIAAESATESAIAAMGELHEKTAAAVGGPGSELSQLNRAFHFAIYEAASLFVAELIRPLWSFIPPSVTLWDDADLAARLSAQHAEILDAIRTRDADSAEALMAQHVASAGQERMGQA